MKLIATLAAALVAATLIAAPAQADDTTRILIVGDSVTHASDGDYSWRYFAWKGLDGAGVDFVGPRQGTHIDGDTWGGTYADADFDTDHAARWGLSMWEMQEKPSENAPTIGDLVADSQPDVIVEQLGVNDFGWFGLSAEQMGQQARRFVTDARAVSPDVDVVLGSIPQTWIREVPTFNAALPGIAAELSTETSRVVVTPVAPFVQGVDTYDPAHPTTEGQQKIAAAVLSGLDALGISSPAVVPVVEEPAPVVEPEPLVEAIAPPPEVNIPAPVVAPEVAPAKPRKVRATDKGRKVRVVWRKAAHADRYVVRCAKASRVVGRTAVKVRTSANVCRVRSVNEAGVSRWVKVRVR